MRYLWQFGVYCYFQRDLCELNKQKLQCRERFVPVCDLEWMQLAFSTVCRKHQMEDRPELKLEGLLG